jgi:hypothetical protein
MHLKPLRQPSVKRVLKFRACLQNLNIYNRQNLRPKHSGYTRRGIDEMEGTCPSRPYYVHHEIVNIELKQIGLGQRTEPRPFTSSAFDR